jgi:ABC-2 type transport system permease protein
MWIRKYARVYRGFVTTCLSEQMSFRLNFASLLLLEVLFFAMAIGGIFVLFEHIERIGDWTRPEFLFFTALAFYVDILFMTLFAANFWEFSADLRMGNLDFVLTKPVSSLFMVFCRRISVGGLVTSTWGLGAVIDFGAQLPEAWTAERIGVFVVFMVAAMALKVGLEILVGTLMFVTVEGEAINLLRLNLQVIQKQPDFVYGPWFRAAFSFVYPLLLVTSIPGHVMVDERWPAYATAFFFVSIAYVWMMVRLAWRRGLRRYESASS